jgi:hypothetical protein
VYRIAFAIRRRPKGRGGLRDWIFDPAPIGTTAFGPPDAKAIGILLLSKENKPHNYEDK